MARISQIFRSTTETAKPLLELLHALYLIHFLIGLGVVATALNWIWPSMVTLMGRYLDAAVIVLFALIFAIMNYLAKKIKQSPIQVFGVARKKMRKYYVELSP